MPFRPESFELFRITSFEVDPENATAKLRYSLDDEYHFTELVDFGRSHSRASPSMSPGQRKSFEAAVRLLHIVAGVSYYKTAAPRRIVIETGELSEAESRLCHDIYDRGLREFAYTNALDIPLDLEIVSAPGSPGDPDDHDGGLLRAGQVRSASREAPAHGVAVPIGGGKDSIVVLESLRAANGELPLLVSVNPSPAVERIASISGLQLARMGRKIDPLLFDLNDRGALNGHVPVTAIVSLIAVAGGFVHGYDTTVMALEGSADSPTRVVRAGSDRPEVDTAVVLAEVNHQWSKSAEFEAQLQEVLSESVHDSVRYLSPLRRFDELEIAAAFSSLPQYFSAFRSCNRAFRMSDALDGWCRDCPKCRFVFLALATVVPRAQVVAIFGGDMLDDETQSEGFLDLLDHRRKPFECVGTVEEVTEAFGRLLDDPAWPGAAVLERVRLAMAPNPSLDRRGRVSGPQALAEIRDTVARAALTRAVR